MTEEEKQAALKDTQNHWNKKRDPERQARIIKLLEQVWTGDMRLCQLLRVVVPWDTWSDSDLYHLEDDKLEQALEDYLKEQGNDRRFS